MSVLFFINDDIRDEEQQIPLDETFDDLLREEEESKCGEIFVTNGGSFTLICVLCKASYENMLQFGEHVRSKHLDENVLVEQQPDILPSVKFEIKEEETQSEHDFLEECLEEDRPHEDLSNSESDSNSTEFPLEQKFSCDICKLEYKSKSSLNRHNKRHKEHEEKALPKEIVSKAETKGIAKKETQLQQDFLEEDFSDSDSESDSTEFPSEPKWSCDICKLEYKSKSSLNRHNKRHKEQDEDSLPKKIVNPKAETKDVSKKSEQTSDNPKWFCEICNRQLRTQRGFRYHSLKHTSAPPALKEDPGYLTCRFCDRKLADQSEWIEHEKTHNSERPFPCPHCDKSFKRRQGLQMHINCHTGERPFQCPHCSKAFAHPTNLNEHIKGVHLQIKPFKCEICDKRFGRKVEKTAHMRHHTGEKPYQCEECGKNFMLAAQMNEHRKQHKSVKDVKCETCGKCFFSKSRLRRHQIIHTGKRAYACSICGHTFITGNALATHKRLHSDVKEYVCSICGREFAQAAGLYSHRKSHGARIDA